MVLTNDFDLYIALGATVDISRKRKIKFVDGRRRSVRSNPLWFAAIWLFLFLIEPRVWELELELVNMCYMHKSTV